MTNLYKVEFTKKELDLLFARPEEDILGWYKVKKDKSFIIYCVDCAMRKKKVFNSKTSFTDIDLQFLSEQVKNLVCFACGKKIEETNA